MYTILYTSDIDDSTECNVLEQSKNKSQGQIEEQNYNIDCGDFSDFIVSIGNDNIVTAEIGNEDGVTAEIGNDNSVIAEIGNEDGSGDILKRKYEKMLAVERYV